MDQLVRPCPLGSNANDGVDHMPRPYCLGNPILAVHPVEKAEYQSVRAHERREHSDSLVQRTVFGGNENQIGEVPPLFR